MAKIVWDPKREGFFVVEEVMGATRSFETILLQFKGSQPFGFKAASTDDAKAFLGGLGFLIAGGYSDRNDLDQAEVIRIGKALAEDAKGTA